MKAARPKAAAVVLEQVCKRFGDTTALTPIDLSVLPGQFVLLAGSNGAGKSTLLRLLAGLTRPSGGRVRVLGGDPVRQAPVRGRIGLLAHQTLLYDDLTAQENLLFYAQLYELPQRASIVDQALDEAGLSRRRQHRVRTFSRGMKQRLALARATLHNPPLLLLDEPFTGLDTSAVEALTQRLQGLKRQGSTCLLVTHRLDTALPLMDRLVVVKRGRACYDAAWPGGDLAQLQATCQQHMDEAP
ncbi:MAG: heme ABC exporter ATP-binding protein CcmA [Candidatus Latescibacteria bacterium]|nr:heme ABC exporter ATP-binding protein CcmA [Candidatus Latescibacterota bacterium]